MARIQRVHKPFIRLRHPCTMHSKQLFTGVLAALLLLLLVARPAICASCPKSVPATYLEGG